MGIVLRDGTRNMGFSSSNYSLDKLRDIVRGERTSGAVGYSNWEDAQKNLVVL